MQEAEGRAVEVTKSKAITALEMPRLVAEAGGAASFAWEEFFIAKLRNPHTRRAYLHAVRSFLAWVEPQAIELARITPGMVGRYFDQLRVSIPSKKLALAAIRSFFDVLVQRHVMVLNPSHSVRTERYSSSECKTPPITIEQAKSLLASIQLCSATDYRDRAIIAVLIYTAVREGAVAKLRLMDLFEVGSQFMLRVNEKGGKVQDIPVRHDLEILLLEYLAVASLASEPKDSPFFRSAPGRAGRLSVRGVSGVDVCRMLKRRLKVAGLPTRLSPHSFRSCTATDLLEQGVRLEDVQNLLNHSDIRTTRQYDRRQRQVTRNIVERISV